MRLKPRILAGVLGALAIGVVRGEAQVSVTAACTPGIPGCASLRFFVAAAGGVDIDQLFVTLLSAAWQFTPGPSATVGTYSAEDSFGPFSGFTTIGGGGSTFAIDFMDNGFPMSIFAGASGLIDVEASGEANVDNLGFRAEGVTASGGSFSSVSIPNVTATPEPATLTLLGTGLAVIGAMGYRRRRKAPA